MKKVRKFDAIPKLNGTYKFIDDYYKPDMLHGGFLYSKCHHGKIKKIKFPPNFNRDEFTIVSHHDILGENIVPEPEKDQPFMAETEVMHFGQVILGVAHQNRQILKKFIDGIEVIYEELPAITDIEECLSNEENAFGKTLEVKHSADIDIKNNLIHTKRVYRTPHQEQAYLETQGMMAVFYPNDNVIFVRGTMQCPYFVKSALDAIFGNSITKSIVETSEGIGGAFGGKEDFPNIIAGITALLAYKSGKPVKAVLDRADDILITTKRHPSWVEIESYTDPITNKLLKVKIDYRLDAGAYQTLSPVVLSRGVLHASSGYAIEDCYIKGRLFRSNTPSNGAFRGFGAPQALFAMESHIDNIAAQLDIDPYILRKKNVLKLGDEFPTTQPVIENNLYDCLEKVLENSNYHKKYRKFKEWNRNNKLKKGIGLSLGLHGGGYTGNGEKVLNSEIKMVIEKNADINIYVANTDMGQGAHTTLAQMVDETIGHPHSKTKVMLPNTDKSPDSGPTVASRTIYIVGNMLRNLIKEIKKQLRFNNLEEYVEKHQDDFPLEFHSHFKPDPQVIFDDKTCQGVAYKDYSWAACTIEITYDPLTYEISVDRCWNVLDVGETVNPEIARGQVEGGVVQAIGYGLSEFFYKKGFGRKYGFTDYTMPTSMDIPKIEIEFIHTDNSIPKGLGEIPMDYPAPALRNAFLNATGLQIDEIPLTPETILTNLGEK
ncbi:MAG: xanthine dehydrogenase family protein molybdopterin-binding subunit [Candidatus Cloacimonadota bacterium]|nr:xanthine dehydrogenase family protein molybdopterin-binding subunit [Candidatus Cloacimonadota bacterium]